MNKTKLYFQPSTIEGVMPEELASFQAFATEEDCQKWLDDHGYDFEYEIREYHNDDIEGVTILDANGNIVEVNDN